MYCGYQPSAAHFDCEPSVFNCDFLQWIRVSDAPDCLPL